MTTYNYTPVTVPLVRSGVFVLRSRGVLGIYNQSIDGTNYNTIGTICGDAVGFAQGYAQIEFGDGTTLTAGSPPTESGWQRFNYPVASIWSFENTEMIVWYPPGFNYETNAVTINYSLGSPRGAASAPSSATYSGGLVLWGFTIGAMNFGGNKVACVGYDTDYPNTPDVLTLSTGGALAVMQPWGGFDENLSSNGQLFVAGDYKGTGKFAYANAFWQNTYYLPCVVIADSTTGSTLSAVEIAGLSDAGHDVIWINAAENSDAVACNVVSGAPYDCPYGFVVQYLDWLFVIAADASWYEAYNLQVSTYDDVGVETFGDMNAFPFGEGAQSTFLAYDDTGTPYAYLLNSDTVPGELLSGGLAGPQLLPLAIPLVLQCVPCAPVLFDPPA